MLLEGFVKNDNRVEKEARSLAKAGHEVHVLCYGKEGEEKVEQWKGIYIHRMFVSSFFIKKLSVLALVFPYYFMKWKSEAKKIVKAESFNAIHVHDLPLAKLGYSLSKKHSLKLVCDQHEFYSNWIKHTGHYNTFIGRIVGFFSNWYKYEKKYLGKADLIISVEEPLRKEYVNVHGFKDEKLICVPNTPDKDIFSYDNILDDVIAKYENNFAGIYVGVVDVLRGVDTIIKAMPKIVKRIPDFKFIIVGRIAKGCNVLELAKDLGVSEYIDFVGWKDISELPSYIVASKFGFFTQPNYNVEANSSIATKIYQYAVMKRPMIVGDTSLTKSFVEGNGLGLSSQDRNPQDLADKVVELYNSYDLFIDRINKSDTEKYGWEYTINTLLNKYSEF